MTDPRLESSELNGLRDSCKKRNRSVRLASPIEPNLHRILEMTMNVRQRTAALIGLMVLICIATTLSVWSIQMEEGVWVLSETQDCTENRLCMEWEPAQGTMYTPSCCLEGGMLGTTVYFPCGLNFRHFH